MNFNPLPNPDQFTDSVQSPDELALVEGDIDYVYADSVGIPTIGIGINLQVAQNMAVILSQISIGGVNLLEAAAQQSQSVSQVAAAFELVITQNPLTPFLGTRTSQTQQEANLSHALDSLAASYFGITPSGTQTAYQVFENASNLAGGANFSSFPPSYATAALGILISNSSASLSGGSGSSSYGPYPISTYSQQLTTWLTNNTSSLVGAAYDVPGSNIAPPNTGQWEALLSLFFNQNPKKNPLVGKGLMKALQKGNVAQAWFQIRYVHVLGQSTTRRYQEAQMFGLAQPGDTAAQAIQAYEMLSENRSTILSYEASYGTNPNVSTDPTIPRNQIAVAIANVAAFNRLQASKGYGSIQAPLNPVATISQAFIPEAELLLSQLNASLAKVTGGIGDLFDTTPGSLTGAFNVRTTDILVAPDSNDTVNGFATLAEDQIKPIDSPTANHLIIGADSVNAGNANSIFLQGGYGNDILIAGEGAEVLQAGSGSDTLIGGQGLGALAPLAGNDVLQGGRGFDVFDFALPSTGTLTETVAPSNGQSGLVEISSGNNAPSVLGGSASIQIGPVANKVWGDAAGALYEFQPNGPDVTFGTLSITGGSALGNNEIVIDNFDLSAAESSRGYLGIFLRAEDHLTAPANSGIDPPAPPFNESADDSYTLSVDVPSPTAQIFAVSLAGANPSDFDALVGNAVDTLSASGSFNVTLAPGETSVSFSLLDLTSVSGGSDIASGASLALSAATPNTDTLAGGLTSTAPVTFNYVPSSPINSAPAHTITGAMSGGVTSYAGDQSNDFVSAGTGPNNINLFASLNDTVVGNGNTSVIVTGDGTNQIYAGSQTSLANAIAAAATAVGTGTQGDLIAAGHGTNTIIGSNSNDFISTDDVPPNGVGGNDVIVLGGGNDTYIGGIDVTGALPTWSVTTGGSPINYYYTPTNIFNYPVGYISHYPEPYNGNEDYSSHQPYGASSATIFGGTGNYFLLLGNGNNYVDVGSGNSSIGLGMGDNTIIAGSGNQDIFGGGGTAYIAGGSGTENIEGGDGNNTIIGGSGNATIYSSVEGLEPGPFPNDNLVNNYVTGGSGNDLIYGSAGADTLIGGTGNVTIYGGSGNENIVGGSGNDQLYGGTGASTIDAGGVGADSLYAEGLSSSTSILYGGDGRDLIAGGCGANTLYAGDGGAAGAPTTVYASQTDSTSTTTIYGGLGVDYLEGGVGASVIYAGDGGTSAAPTTVVGVSGTDTLYGGLGTDILQAGTGNTLIYAGDGGTSFAPTTVTSGAGVDTLVGGAGPSLLQDALSGQDLISAGTSNDTLIGIGSDTLIAGSGNDLLQTNNGSTNFEFNAGFGNDTILTNGGSVNLLLGDGVLATDLVGSVAQDSFGHLDLTLTGDGGSISIQNALTGGLVSALYVDPSSIPLPTLLQDVFGGDQTFTFGSDTFTVNLANGESLASTYYDTISSWGSGDSLTSSSYYDNIYSTGSAALIASQDGYGSIVAAGANATVNGGYADAITLSGANGLENSTSGSDVVTASGTNDTILAVSGSSTFDVNNASAVIQVTGAAASDIVNASVSFTAPTNVNTLNLVGSANIAATGNAASDQLTGGAGNDTLIAGSGLATMTGGSGNTTFVVNNASDVVRDYNSLPSNTIQSSVNFTLPNDVNTLALSGTSALIGTANNANDTLIANSGADTLIGGIGNDTFILNSTSDVVVDTAGVASIQYSGSARYTLPAGINSLIAIGSAAVQVTGNSGNDTLVSNSGIDTLIGGSGVDAFIVNNSLDVVQDAVTTNTLQSSVNYSLPANVNFLTLTGTASLTATGNAGADTLIANSGNDTLTAGAGLATLVGGAGTDTFVINNSNDVIQESVAGSNTVVSSVSTTLGSNLNALLFTGTAALVGTANSGADTLTANSGADTLIGGAGNDIFVVSSSSAVVQDTVVGTLSQIDSSALSYTLPNNVNSLLLTGTAALTATGNSGSDVLTANTGRDTLVGGAGSDTLISGATQVNQLVGGSGSDLFIVNNSGDIVTVSGAHGSDTIESSFSTTLPTAVNSLLLIGSANLTGTALSGNNVITGNAGNDVLKAGSGSDELIAGAGIDTLIGGAGSDTFVIDNPLDVLQSVSAAGNTVDASISYTLPTNVTTLLLTGTANLTATGNAQADQITTNTGNDTLTAGTGADTFYSGQGSNLFIINSLSDQVVVSNALIKVGTDTIDSSLSYTASTVSTLVLTGTANLTGSESSGKATMLVANAGHDTLTAGTGADTLVAGSGIATLVGGANNNTFVINSTSDGVQDTVSGNSNVLLSSVNYTLPTNVNAILLTGTAALRAVGNTANDSMVGNAGADTLVAGTGTDTLVAGSGLATLVGGAGADTFIVNNTADLIQSASTSSGNNIRSSVTYSLPTNVNQLTLIGIANISGFGNTAADTLIGGYGNDTLTAGAGVATLIGGLGNTTFVVNAGGDVVTDTSTTASNNIQSTVNYTLVNNVNTLAFTGTAALKGTANTANDTLVSNSGADTLVGGSGNETFVVNNSADILLDTVAGASNVAQSTVNYSLASCINTLLLLGTGALKGIANTGTDTLISNSGVDTLIGGTGSDTFLVNNALDVVQDATAAGNSIQAAVNFSLPTNVNILQLVGSAALSGVGNSAADLIIANGGADTLTAGGVNSTLIGGTGNDTFVVNSASDIVQDTLASASNTLQSSVSVTLTANVNTLLLSGTAALVGTANGANDTLTSNTGVDTLVGGAGNELFVVNNAADVIVNGTASDTVESSVNYTLPSTINYLVLIGSANLSASSNANVDIISGNAGSDTFVVNNANDLVQDTSSTANNLILSSVSYSLPTNVDSLTLTGTAGLRATGNTDTNNVLTGNAGNDVLVGSAYNNTLIGGAGSDNIDAGPGLNVIYAGNGGTPSQPTFVVGNATGTTIATSSTIYGGGGSAVLYGGPGTDLIYGAAGAQSLQGGTGFDTLFGAAGNYLSDAASGFDLLVGGAGAETLNGTGADTLQAGSGNDALSAYSSSAGTPTFEFGPTFGQDSISGINGANLLFNGISPGAVTATETELSGYPNLVLNDGSGSIQIPNGFGPGVVNTLQFSGSSAMSLTQFLQQYGPGTVTAGTGSTQSLLSTNSNQSVVASSNDEFVYTFGNNDTITDYQAPYLPPVYIYSSNSAIYCRSAWVIGSGDTFNSVASGTGDTATITGANDTVVSTAYQPENILIEDPTTVFNAAVNSEDSITSYVSFTLPTNVSQLTLASGYASLVGTSSSLGGTLIAQGSFDTLVGGAGSDTLQAIGANGTLISGTGRETFLLSGSSETVELGSGSASLNTIQTYVSYTLGSAANSLIVTGGYATAVGNNANDFLKATSYNDTVRAGSGNDTLADGSNSYAVTMVGGAGNDTFEVNNAQDVLIESFAAASNVVVATVSYSLPTDINTMLLGGAGGLVATANASNDSLVSGSGGDTLLAGSGTDTLVGGSGPDTFAFNTGFGHELVVNSGNGDVVQFGAGITESSLTFTAVLGTGGAPASLVIAGDGGSVTIQGGLLPGAINAVDFSGGGSYTVGQLIAPSGRATIAGGGGNLIVSTINGDVITGGSGNDTIDAFGNNDTLNAGSGGSVIYAGGASDVVVGGAATDTLDAIGLSTTLIGGSGHETFIVNDPSTVIQVSPGVGSTMVLSAVSYTVPANVSNLTLTGTLPLSATGNSGSDVITGNAGFDTLIAGTGIDTLIGGSLADTFVVNNSSDVVQPASAMTNDTINSVATSFTLPSNVNNLLVSAGSGTGNSGSDYIQGSGNLYAGSGADTLQGGEQYGGSGADLLLNGGDVTTGTGIDTIVNAYGGVVINNSADSIASLNVSAYVGELITNVNYTLAASANVIRNYVDALPWVLNGSANLAAADNANTDVVFTPNYGIDTLIGGPDLNVFHVPYGALATEIGGPGTNYFYVRNSADVISAPAGSNDIVVTDLNYTLPSNINQLVLIGVNNYEDLASEFGVGDRGETGGLVGVANSGNDTLDSTGGNTLKAGSGVDSLLGTAGDTLVAGSGTDTLSTIVGFGDFGGTPLMLFNPGFGNVYANAGAIGATFLEFGSGIAPSSLTASAVLGPNGSPTLKINDGSSNLTFNNISLYEFFLGGTDTQPGLLSTQLLSQVQIATSSVVGYYGNEVLEGNASQSVVGGTGADLLYAGAVYDTVVAGSGSQTLTALRNSDSLVAGSGADSLYAAGMADTLVAGSGSVTMYGSSAGTSTYIVNSAGDLVVGDAVNLNDTIESSVSYAMGTGIGTLVLTGSAALTGTASYDRDTLIANSGADTLIGGGLDTFVVGSVADVIQEGNSNATDVVRTSASYSLPTNVNTLIFGGSAGLLGTANNGADTLTSNTGIDSFVGGAGNDYFILNNAADQITDTAAGAANTVQASFSYSLLTNVNALILTGTSALMGTANSGSDTLTSNSGYDTLVGGSGNDTFVINNANDLIQDTASGATNVAQSSVSYSVASNVNNLALTGTSALMGTANNGADTLTSNSGFDTLVGGAGNDVFIINNSSDLVQDNSSSATNTAKSSVSYSLSTNVNNLLLTGSAALTGSANAGNDSLTGNTGADTLIGGTGADTLVAGTGVSSLVGGTGNTTFVINNAMDAVQDSYSAASNTLRSSVAYSLVANVNALVLTGTAALKGSANNAADTLTSNTGLDTLVGGSGNDVFVISNSSDVIQDTSGSALNAVMASVSYSLPINVNALTFTGSTALIGRGNSGNDSMTANTGADTLVAGNGVDTLVSGTGSAIDSLVGGTGNDLFVVNYAGDIVNVGGTHGADTIQSSANFTTSANVATLIFTGTANLSGTGNTIANTVKANSGNDTLTAGSGTATLVGGSGNDTFVVNSASDVVQDTASAATNVISSSVSYTLVANVNRLILTGTAALVGTANSGNDTLTANTGADTLVSGSGAAIDSLVGGTGADRFVINNTSDVVTVGGTHGVDTIQSSVSYSAAANVANLIFTGTAALAGTGNSLAGTLTANNGADTLTAGSGADTLVAGTGNDLFIVNSASDVVSVGATHGIDTIESSVSYTASTNVSNLMLIGTSNLVGTGNSLADTITANNANDTLAAGAGLATLVGGAGNDTFVVNQSGDVVIDTSTTATNAIQSSVNYTLAANVNRLILTGTSALVGTANSGNDTLTANTGADTLVSGSGTAVDSLVGGTGTNLFVVNNASDIVNVGSTHGVDTIQSSVSYSAAANVANLTLLGTAALSGTGSSIAGLITANTGNDTLTAIASTDTLVGGTGTDLFIVNNATQVVNLATSGTSDTIQSSVSYTLPTNVQYLSLSGTSAIAGTGNGLTDLIIGNTANDSITGGTGIAVLEGGRTSGSDQIKALSNQGALIGGAGSATMTGGAYKDFFAAGKVSDSITTGATANVVSINDGDGATVLQPTSGATNVLSLGAGIDTENLYFTKSSNNLILTDGVAGDSVTFTNWYVGAADQNYTNLQVVEIASANYNSGGGDTLRNKALEDFNFTTLVNAFNTAGSPANWALSTAMPSAQLASSSTADYGGDLAYYFGLNGNLTGVNLTAAQSTLTNASFATATQTIDAFSGISGGGGLHLSVVKPGAEQADAGALLDTEDPSDTPFAIERGKLPQLRGGVMPHNVGNFDLLARRGIEMPARTQANSVPVASSTVPAELTITGAMTRQLTADALDATVVSASKGSPKEILTRSEAISAAPIQKTSSALSAEILPDSTASPLNTDSQAALFYAEGAARTRHQPVFVSSSNAHDFLKDTQSHTFLSEPRLIDHGRFPMRFTAPGAPEGAGHSTISQSSIDAPLRSQALSISGTANAVTDTTMTTAGPAPSKLNITIPSITLPVGAATNTLSSLTIPHPSLVVANGQVESAAANEVTPHAALGATAAKNANSTRSPATVPLNFVNPINVAWLTLHGTLDEINTLHAGGHEVSQEHPQPAIDALLATSATLREQQTNAHRHAI